MAGRDVEHGAEPTLHEDSGCDNIERPLMGGLDYGGDLRGEDSDDPAFDQSSDSGHDERSRSSSTRQRATCGRLPRSRCAFVAIGCTCVALPALLFVRSSRMSGAALKHGPITNRPQDNILAAYATAYSSASSGYGYSPYYYPYSPCSGTVQQSPCSGQVAQPCSAPVSSPCEQQIQSPCASAVVQSPCEQAVPAPSPPLVVTRTVFPTTTSTTFPFSTYTSTTTTHCCLSCRSSGSSPAYCRQICQPLGVPEWQLDQECGMAKMLTTTTTPPPKLGQCEIYGDPHITTFDHWHTTNYIEGEYWLVKSDMVKIQARYKGIPGTNQLSVMKALVISGLFMTDVNADYMYRIVVQPEGAYFGKSKMLDSSDEYRTFPARQLKYGTVSGHFDHNGIRMQRGIPKSEQMNVVHLLLPLGVNLTINTWRLSSLPGNDWINVHLEMPPVPGGQDGQCGNFNGDVADDRRTQVQRRGAWQVPDDPGARLFVGDYWPSGFRGKFRNIAKTLTEACKQSIEDYCNDKYPSPAGVVNPGGVNQGGVMKAHVQQDYDRNDCQHKYSFDEVLPNSPCPAWKPAQASSDGWVAHTD